MKSVPNWSVRNLLVCLLCIVFAIMLLNTSRERLRFSNMIELQTTFFSDAKAKSSVALVVNNEAVFTGVQSELDAIMFFENSPISFETDKGENTVFVDDDVIDGLDGVYEIQSKDKSDNNKTKFKYNINRVLARFQQRKLNYPSTNSTGEIRVEVVIRTGNEESLDKFESKPISSTTTLSSHKYATFSKEFIPCQFYKGKDIAVIIEQNNFHHEVIPSMVVLARALGAKCIVLALHDISGYGITNLIKMQGMLEDPPFSEIHTIHLAGDMSRRYLQYHNPRLVVFNSFDFPLRNGLEEVLKVATSLSPKPIAFAVCHHPGSSCHKNAKMVKKLGMNPILFGLTKNSAKEIDNLSNNKDNDTAAIPFSPNFFPNQGIRINMFKNSYIDRNNNSNNNNSTKRIGFIMFGQVSYKRKHFDVLKELADAYAKGILGSNPRQLQFHIHGRYKNDITKQNFTRLKIYVEKKTKGNIIITHSYGGWTKGLSVIPNSHYILPLLDETSFKKYKTILSSSFAMSLAFNLPIVGWDTLMSLYEWPKVPYTTLSFNESSNFPLAVKQAVDIYDNRREIYLDLKHRMRAKVQTDFNETLNSICKTSGVVNLNFGHEKGQLNNGLFATCNNLKYSSVSYKLIQDYTLSNSYTCVRGQKGLLKCKPE